MSAGRIILLNDIAERFLERTHSFFAGDIGAQDQIEHSREQLQLDVAICGGQRPEEQKLDLLLIILTCCHRPGIPDWPMPLTIPQYAQPLYSGFDKADNKKDDNMSAMGHLFHSVMSFDETATPRRHDVNGAAKAEWHR